VLAESIDAETEFVEGVKETIATLTEQCAKCSKKFMLESSKPETVIEFAEALRKVASIMVEGPNPAGGLTESAPPSPVQSSPAKLSERGTRRISVVAVAHQMRSQRREMGYEDDADGGGGDDSQWDSDEC
jgi:hypothetical protein